jgi:predicted dehydrogenase
MALSRRAFLGASAAAAIAAGATGRKTVLGANDRIRVACIGIRGQGGGHIKNFLGMDDCEVVALCDVDQNVLEGRAKGVQEASGKMPKTYRDIRELLADDGIDAVSIAMPNHWHSLATVWACMAGKDVYVEKPLSHNIYEGRQVVAAAEKHGRIVQHGTQRRSDARWIRAFQRMREGVIGDVYMARALCFKPRGSIGMGQEMAPPPHLDWNLWQGPAQERPYMDYPDKEGDHGIYVHYNWHWFWDYGNGDIGNQGVHQMDIAVWGMDKGMPVKVSSAGGRYTYEDQAETPNTQTTTFTYADGTMSVFEVRGRFTNDEQGTKIGNLFYGSEGHFAEGADFNFLNPKGEVIPDDKDLAEMVSVDGNPFRNFLNAVRSRKQEDVHGTAMDGHISSVHCHLANIAYRVGTTLEFDPATERFTGNGAEAANALLGRDYRQGFEMPQIA